MNFTICLVIITFNLGIDFFLQLLRQLLDDKTLCTLEKPFEWKTIEGFNVIAAMSMSDNPGVSSTKLSERFLVGMTLV